MKDCTNTFYSPNKRSQDEPKRQRLVDLSRSSSPKPSPMATRVVSNDFHNINTTANTTTPTQTADAMVFEVTPTYSPPSKRRRVRFDASVHVQYAEEAGLPEKVAAPTPKKTDIWYSRKEIETCRREVVAMLKRRNREGVITLGGTPSSTITASVFSSAREGGDGHDMSFRGVEDLLSKRAFQERKKRKRVVVEKVLKEQARQAALKIMDPESLGMKSQLASKARGTWHSIGDPEMP